MSGVEPVSAGEQLIRFVAAGPAEGRALWSFRDPVAAQAVIQRARDSDTATEDSLSLAVLPLGAAEETFAAWSQRVAGSHRGMPVYLKVRGVELWWRPGHAVLQCEPEEADALRAAVVEFTFYERELRRLEDEVAGSWQELEADRRLAYAVTDADLQGADAFGERMGRALGRRIRFARLEPHLLAPDASLRAAAQTLGSSLRDKTAVESRAEALDAQLEVFDHIYELASPRMGESRDAHEGQRIEWIIIWLLVAEVALSLFQLVVRH